MAASVSWAISFPMRSRSSTMNVPATTSVPAISTKWWMSASETTAVGGWAWNRTRITTAA